jgi:cupin 2 domain-containing protein
MAFGKSTSLFAIDAPLPETERFDELYRKGAVRIERIVSSGTQAPVTYVQEQDEWVALLRGTAKLRVGEETLSLSEGDCVALPAKVPHEVLETSEGAVWLAVHIHPHHSTNVGTEG